MTPGVNMTLSKSPRAWLQFGSSFGHAGAGGTCLICKYIGWVPKRVGFEESGTIRLRLSGVITVEGEALAELLAVGRVTLRLASVGIEPGSPVGGQAARPPRCPLTVR